MNFYDVCYEPESLSAKIIGICKKLRPILPLEGHCPKIKVENYQILYQKVLVQIIHIRQKKVL